MGRPRGLEQFEMLRVIHEGDARLPHAVVCELFAKAFPRMVMCHGWSSTIKPNRIAWYNIEA